VRRIEVNDQHVRVVFRVDPGPTGHSNPTQISHGGFKFRSEHLHRRLVFCQPVRPAAC
jgi:hypothetical protein